MIKVKALLYLFFLYSMTYLMAQNDMVFKSTPPTSSKGEFDVSIVTSLPDFGAYPTVTERKEAFFILLSPLIEGIDDRYRRNRETMFSLYHKIKKGLYISPGEIGWLNKMALHLKVKSFDAYDSITRLRLEKKMDIIPKSLFLAQAAIESSWGTSRFAREGNNIFGQWCFRPGCGIVPSQRSSGDTQEVRKFASVNEAIESYVRNINMNTAYKKLRELRYEERKAGKVPSGLYCAAGLYNYSARKGAYVKEIKSIIRSNYLE